MGNCREEVLRAATVYWLVHNERPEVEFAPARTRIVENIVWDFIAAKGLFWWMAQTRWQMTERYQSGRNSSSSSSGDGPRVGEPGGRGSEGKAVLLRRGTESEAREDDSIRNGDGK